MWALNFQFRYRTKEKITGFYYTGQYVENVFLEGFLDSNYAMYGNT